MAYSETKTPYEFLIRWDNNGVIQGAHIAFLETVLKDGVIVNQTQSSVESVEIAGQLGFPLSYVLSQIQIDALKQVDVLKAENEVLKAENEVLKAENESLKTPV